MKVVELFTSFFSLCYFYRPFAGLTDIMTHHKDLLQNKFQLIELMGLTQERVMEFVDKYVAKIKREFVKKTLKNNPILLSVCAITFYCAALCELLIDEKVVPTELTTYSWITFRILQVQHYNYAQRIVLTRRRYVRLVQSCEIFC